jgi:hypothetical protein
MAQGRDIVGVPSDQNRSRDLGGVLGCLGRDQIADVMSVNALVVDTETSTSWGILSTAPCVGITVSPSSVRRIDS